MAQSGYTPILIYASGTATNVPLAANMTSSASGAELALNYADGKLYYKNSAGVVTLLVGTGGAGVVAGSNTQVQYNNNGVFGASANMTFNGTTLTVAGLSNTGNTTLGDASADTVTVNGTITSNLIFTDNTYDIGASGATRPRNLFLAGNATISGAQTLTGALTVDSTTDSTSTTTGSIQTDGGVGIAKALYVGTTANIAGALTVNTTALVSSGTNNIGINTASPLTNGATYGTLTINGSNGGAIQFATAGVSIAQVYNDGNALFINPATGKTLSLQIASSTVASISSTGLAVTGTLSATGNLTSPTLQLGTNPAGVSIGVLGIPNQKRIYGRNAANSADVNIAYVDGSNGLVFGPGDAATIDSSSNLSVQGFQFKLGTSGTSQVTILRAARPSAGSSGLQIYGGASATVNDAAPAAYITLGSGPLGDTYEGGVGYYAYGNTTGSGFQNAHTWYRRTSVDTTSQTMQISPTGVLDIGTGAGAVGQIKFPATQVASSNANTLDDYEEGSWTPTDGSGASLSFTGITAYYTKIGRVVNISAYFSYPTNSNDASLDGLPFSLATNGYGEIIVRTIGGTPSQTVLIQINGTSATFYYAPTGGTQPTNAQLTGVALLFQGTYITAT